MASEWDASELPKTGLASQSRHPVVPPKLRLLVLTGPDQGKQLELDRGTYLVGKAPGCALVLTDPIVSRQHLELQITEHGVLVKDLQSTNGSFFGGARFSEVTVGAGAVITIGSSELRIASTGDQHALPPSAADHFGALLGSSLRMREVFSILERVAPTEAVVLIEGETGTGKELCAEALHAASPRARGPFVIVDLAGVSRSLIESELFGHVRGAFTGADRDRDGAFAQAHGGTIFIDEVGELELEAQPRLLRALEQRKVKPVGAAGWRDVDVRVLAATNRDLREEVKAGRFRDDLYHRLAVVKVTLPPLRERKEDVATLVSAFLAGRDIEVPDETQALLSEYDWPGNVRELKNVIERGVSLMGAERVLRPSLLGLEAPPQPAAGAVVPSFGALGGEGFREAKERLIAAWEREYVTQLLRRAGGNVSRAAREGGIDRVYLHRLMKKHGIGSDEP
ncbi:MAG TPA: sigma 54-interacting transcriptional regulator [Polyangia bacterium]|nr:sigma 54-interacting transcriptional regulator [Polyangia bacterium]